MTPTPDPIPSPVPEVVQEARRLQAFNCEFPGNCDTTTDGKCGNCRTFTTLIASEEAREKAEADRKAWDTLAQSLNAKLEAAEARAEQAERQQEAQSEWIVVERRMRDATQAERDSLRVQVERQAEELDRRVQSSQENAEVTMALSQRNDPELRLLVQRALWSEQLRNAENEAVNRALRVEVERCDLEEAAWADAESFQVPNTSDDPGVYRHVFPTPVTMCRHDSVETALLLDGSAEFTVTRGPGCTCDVHTDDRPSG